MHPDGAGRSAGVSLSPGHFNVFSWTDEDPIQKDEALALLKASVLSLPSGWEYEPTQFITTLHGLGEECGCQVRFGGKASVQEVKIDTAYFIKEDGHIERGDRCAILDRVSREYPEPSIRYQSSQCADLIEVSFNS